METTHTLLSLQVRQPLLDFCLFFILAPSSLAYLVVNDGDVIDSPGGELGINNDRVAGQASHGPMLSP
jgi:hypothetical protein